MFGHFSLILLDHGSGQQSYLEHSPVIVTVDDLIGIQE